jgi:ribonuclease P protein component
MASHGVGLPRSVRLRTPREFQVVQTGGRSFDLGPLIFRVARSAEGADARLGLAISRKVGNSVVRNHVKRRVRECFRRRQLSLTGCQLVVTGRPAAAQLETGDVDKLFEQFLQRLGRLPRPDSRKS